MQSLRSIGNLPENEKGRKKAWEGRKTPSRRNGMKEKGKLSENEKERKGGENTE